MPEMIPFNHAAITPLSGDYIAKAVGESRLAAGGQFGEKCAAWLQQRLYGLPLMTHSATAALEMSVRLADVEPGEEVILPSWTFPSTANAVVLNHAIPVFVDVDEDTLTIDTEQARAARTDRARAVIAVHYAGVAADMRALDGSEGYPTIEDAAQGLGATYHGQPLGSIGSLAALSFHETKNVTCGEGGAVIVNRYDWRGRAEVIHAKGTDRAAFLRGEVDRYSWQDAGSSYALGEIPAAFLWGQLEQFDAIQSSRMRAWDTYHALLEPLEDDGRLRRPVLPAHCGHNAHMYYILLPEGSDRPAFLANLYARGVHAVFHYVPLHSSPAGRRFGRTYGDTRVTDSVARRIVRLPLWAGMPAGTVERVCEAVTQCL